MKYEYRIKTAAGSVLVINADNLKHLKKIFSGKFIVISRTARK